MKRFIILAAVLLPAFLLMGAAVVEREPAIESQAYTPPAAVETPAPEPEPTPEPNPPGFRSSLSDPAEDTHTPRPWSYDRKLSAAENIKSFLVEEAGFSVAAASGIMASIDVETGGTFDPKASNPVSYGLCQWLGDRLENLRTREDYDEIATQLEFMVWELENDDPYGTLEYLNSVEDSASGAYNAGWYFAYWFERPAELERQSVYRACKAIEYYNDWSNE